ncbi:unnamed protein product [Rotaria magnacalcarata]|uniref:Uncharacterized protein n=1 Tax=Rotaria magnacalcarata TaxID=392030 RepID=A0A816MBC3_9BILA|nr:unnamed protein product [Rotaria magnacalcarata]
MMSIPNSYQQEPIPIMINTKQSFQPIPMGPQYNDHSIGYSNAFKNNRIGPQQPDYNMSYQSNNSNRVPSSIQSTKGLIQPSRDYSLKQSAVDGIYPYNSNQSYYSQNKYMENAVSDEYHGKNKTSTSCFWQLTCFGLTRLTAGILFGTMILLMAISIGGLVVSVILYVQDPSTNSQWKILGIVVSCVMLITIIVTLCIFIYCYKNGRIGNSDQQNNSETKEYNQENDFRKRNYFNRSYDMSSLPYGTNQNVSPFSTNEDIIQVEDKQTNTEITMAPLRPRDCQRGVWPGNNAYGGLSYRSFEKPTMTHRFIQTSSNEDNQTVPQGNINLMNIPPRTIIRLPGSSQPHHHGEYSSRFNETIPSRLIGRPIEDYVEHPQLQKNVIERLENRRKIQIFNNVSVKSIKTFEEPDITDEFTIDHFYQ